MSLLRPLINFLLLKNAKKLLFLSFIIFSSVYQLMMTVTESISTVGLLGQS